MTQAHPTPPSPFRQAIAPYLLTLPDRVVRYGLGCAYLHRALEDREAVRESLRTLAMAYDTGFRYFDTAAAYGNSEAIVGEFVASVPRERIFLATKSSIPKDLSPARLADHVKRSLEESLIKLKTSYVDLFQLHDFYDTGRILNGAEPIADGPVSVLQEARRQGLIRFFGPATRPHAVLEACARTGAFDTILTYSDYTLHNQSAAPLIETVHALGMGVINASPISGLGRYGFDLKDPQVLSAALQLPLTNPRIDITLTGPSNAAELASSLEALRRVVDWEAWKAHRHAL